MTPADTTSPTFGDRLRAFRFAAGITQEELAERAGLSTRGVSNLERGVNRYPYRGTVLRLVEALQLEAVQADQLLKLALRRRGPSVKVTPAWLVRIPIPPTSTVGREAETKLVLEFIRGKGCRLVTLTGTGGVGKTRVALEVAGELGTAYPDGALFVPLDSITDPGSLPQLVMTGLGLSDSEGPATLSGLLDVLGEREMLLVLDNFEHLLAATSTVLQMVHSCPRLTILVTSREHLRLRAEQEIRIEPLQVPPSSVEGKASHLPLVPSVRLFLDRAASVQPEFALTEANGESVAELCRRLDGLPLAIELAAARVKAFPPSEIVRLLSSRLGTLTEGPRDLPTRQQTIRGAIDWSYNLLTSEEKTIFSRLSVFVGGASLNAVMAVCGPTDSPRVVDIMSSLVEKNLLEPPTAGGHPRFRMLETLREYAWERLARSGDMAIVRELHARYFERLLTTVPRRHEAMNEETAQLGLDADLGNLGAAGRWALEQGDIASATLLLRAAAHIGRDRGEQDGTIPSALVGALLEEGRFVEAVEVAEAELERAASSGDGLAALKARLLAQRSTQHLQSPAWSDTARPLVDEAIPRFHAARDEGGLALAWLVRADISHVTCQFAEMVEAAQTCHRHARVAGDYVTERLALRRTAIGLFLGPAPVGEALNWFDELDSRQGDSLMISVHRSVLLAMSGDVSSARDELRNRDRLEQLGTRLLVAGTAQHRWQVEKLAGDFEEAERAAREGCRLLSEIGERSLFSTLACMLAESLFELDRMDEAAHWVQRSRDTGTEEDTMTQAYWRMIHARLLARGGDPLGALRFIDEALRLLDHTDLLDLKADVLAASGEILELARRTEDALEAKRAAQSLYLRKGNIVSARRVEASRCLAPTEEENI